MNWGLKIIIMYGLFAAGIITMVAISMNKNVDLVNDNYYEHEIKYQNQIDILKKSRELNDKILVDYRQNEIVINYTDIGKESDISGKIGFYRSSDAKKDFNIDINPDEAGMQKVSASELDLGQWKIQFDILRNNEKYFVEKIIFIN